MRNPIYKLARAPDRRHFSHRELVFLGKGIFPVREIDQGDRSKGPADRESRRLSGIVGGRGTHFLLLCHQGVIPPKRSSGMYTVTEEQRPYRE